MMTKKEYIFSYKLLFLGLGYLVVEKVYNSQYRYDTDTDTDTDTNTILADAIGSGWPCWNQTVRY